MAEVDATNRTYIRRLILAMLAYVVLSFGVVLLNKAVPAGAWRYPLFLVPVIPLVVAAWAVFRMISDVDELQRRIQLEGLAFAFGGGSLVTTAYGMLQAAGLPDVSWLFVWPVYAVCWVVGLTLAQRRYA